MSRRALLLGPMFPPGIGGGLALALDDLSNALEQRGWCVERPRVTEEPGKTPRAMSRAWEESTLSGVLGSSTFVRVRSRIPRSLRQCVINLTRPRDAFEQTSAVLVDAERRLRRGTYDVVLVCPAKQPPGLLALAASLHARVVAISLTGLTDELRYAGLWAAVRLIRVGTGRGLHSGTARPVEPSALVHTVFASEAWRQDGIRAGLPPERTSTIYFGVATGHATARDGGWRDRLLWVGRLSPEKGLHELLRALPAVSARSPGTMLTAVASRGPEAYRRLIVATIAGPNSSISLLDAQRREELQKAYGDHDALIFYSAFDEPVALVVLEAFAAGLPVIASRPKSGAGPLREGVTCLCFDRDDDESLARAVATLGSNPALRATLVSRAREVVQSEYSLDRMGDAYDALLRRLL